MWVLRRVRADGELRGFVGFTLAATAFAITLFTVAVLSRSLALLALGFHFLHFLLSLFITLMATLLPPSTCAPRAFSYGYKRVPVLATYAAGVLLLFTSFAVFMEAVHRAFHTDEIDCTWIPPLCAGSLMLVGWGSAWLKDPGALSGHRRRPFLAWKNTLVATVPSWLTLGSALLVIYWEDRRPDTAAACAAALWGALQALPALRRAGTALLQAAPGPVLRTLERAVREVSEMEGVRECSDDRFWTLADGVLVGSMRVRVDAAASEQDLLRRIHPLFEPLLTHLTVEVEKMNPQDDSHDPRLTVS